MSAHISGGYAKEPPTYGKVLLHTTIGDIDIELWPKQAPKACRNFVQLLMEEYYNDCIFHRVIPNFMAQTGDPTGTGEGGDSIYGIPFKDEFHSRLTFCHRGIVAMANSGKNDNKSQFFITLDKCDWLNRKHTIFGKVTGNTLYNVLKFNDMDIGKDTDRPLIEQRIIGAEILLNPFDDIQARISKTDQIIETQKAKEQQKLDEQQQMRSMGAKNDTKLLAFGDDDEDEEEQQDLMDTEQRLITFKTKQTDTNETQSDNANDSSNNNKNDKTLEQSTEGSSKMMDIIRAKLSNQKRSRAPSDRDDSDGDEHRRKKRKMDEAIGSHSDEYEMLKQKLLDTQGANDGQVDYEEDEEEENEAPETLHGVALLMEQREEYMKKTRMNQKQRAKFTMNGLSAFQSQIDEMKGNESNESGGEKKGKVDESTGIQFDCESDEEEYDPNWFKCSLEFKKRPQDIEIYSVDDYETIYGNSKQTADTTKNNATDHSDRVKTRKKSRDNEQYYHDRNRR